MFTLTPTSVYADWPPRFASDNGLPETEICDATGPDITADVDPNEPADGCVLRRLSYWLPVGVSA